MFNKFRLFFASILLAIFSSGSNANTLPESESSTLTPKQQSIILIAALTAQGDLESLAAALDEGLTRDLTINEIKEILIQMYAYTGFPRSLNGIITFEKVLKSRQEKGIYDEIGEEPNQVRTGKSKYEIGKENITLLTGVLPSGHSTGYAAFVPTIEVFLKEHLFADIFERGVLDYQTRELITVSALTSLGNVNTQLKSHINVSMHNGITESQLRDLIALINNHIDKDIANNATTVLNQVLSNRQQ